MAVQGQSTVEIFPRAGRWFVRIRAENGRIILESKSYSSKFNAERGALALITAVATAIIEVLPSE